MVNSYIPHPVEITNIHQEYQEINTYTLRFRDREVQREFDFQPGQFLQVSINGVGEAPISINSSPKEGDYFKLCIERKGNVTKAIFDLEEGSTLFARGPYGNGFPVDEVEGKNVLFVAGGIGLAPLRSAIEYISETKGKYMDAQILYGDKTPTCLLFDRYFSTWDEDFDMNVICEEATPEWSGEEGMVTDLMNRVYLDAEETVSFICGPSIMYKFALPELLDLGFEEGDIYLSYERRMECGIGMCRRCNIGDKFVCQDGPVFSYDEIKRYEDKET